MLKIWPKTWKLRFWPENSISGTWSITSQNLQKVQFGGCHQSFFWHFFEIFLNKSGLKMPGAMGHVHLQLPTLFFSIFRTPCYRIIIFWNPKWRNWNGNLRKKMLNSMTSKKRPRWPLPLPWRKITVSQNLQQSALNQQLPQSLNKTTFKSTKPIMCRIKLCW